MIRPVMKIGPIPSIARARDQPFENPRASPEMHIAKLKII